MTPSESLLEFMRNWQSSMVSFITG